MGNIYFLTLWDQKFIFNAMNTNRRRCQQKRSGFQFHPLWLNYWSTFWMSRNHSEQSHLIMNIACCQILGNVNRHFDIEFHWFCARAVFTRIVRYFLLTPPPVIASILTPPPPRRRQRTLKLSLFWLAENHSREFSPPILSHIHIHHGGGKGQLNNRKDPLCAVPRFCVLTVPILVCLLIHACLVATFAAAAFLYQILLANLFDICCYSWRHSSKPMTSASISVTSRTEWGKLME